MKYYRVEYHIAIPDNITFSQLVNFIRRHGIIDDNGNDAYYIPSK